MSPCQWQDQQGNPCGRKAHGDGHYCLWHNSRVRKSDPYVIPLLEQELLLRSGSAIGFHLEGLLWPQAELPGVVLREADLRDAVLPAADLVGADLSNADLSRANLSGANLTRACLRGANLTGTHLGNASLQDADLRGATIDGTVLLAADLRGADLSDTVIAEFTWNRFTRFAGIRGFEPPRKVGDTSNDATVPFPSPLASNNDSDISSSALASLGPLDPALSRTRVYRNLARSRGSVDNLQALVPRSSASMPAPPPPIPMPTSTARWSKRLLVALVLVATLWAVAATAVATWTTLTMSETTVIVDRGEDSGPGDSQGPIDSREIYLREIQSRDQALANARRGLDELTSQLGLVQRDLNHMRADNQRLRTAADENVALHQELQTLREDLRRIAHHNRRLEETASILVSGNEVLLQDNDTLLAQNQQRFTELEEVGRFRAERDRARAELEEMELALASATSDRDRLRNELERSSANLERFLTRLEGTRLEGLLAGEEQRGPLLRITPGRSLSLGGDDLLISLRIEPAEQAGRVRVHAVVQRSDSRVLPDLSIVLYGSQGEALRRLSFSFPAANPQSPFASTVTEIDSPVFPSAVRVSAAQGIDDHLLSQQP